MKLLTILLLFLLGCTTEPEPEDCADVPGGAAELDNCNVCDTDLTNDCETDCLGVWGGDTVEDECGVCGGDGSTCIVCADCSDSECCDCDGNVYETVQIGEQLWMAENLKTTHYNDGSEITHITNNEYWGSYDEGQYGVYDNDLSNAEIYGNLYNFAVVDDSLGVCPEGFHVSSDDEWTILMYFIAPEGIESWGNSIAGGKMKEAGLDHWNSPNTGATNASGFNGFPAGDRGHDSGSYDNMGYYGSFWSSSEFSSYYAWYRKLDYNFSNVYRYATYKQNGFSIRCLGD